MYLFKIGLLLGFSAVLLQIAVFLQPLLPKQYQIAPVCETISQALVESHFYEKQQHRADFQSLDHQHLNQQSVHQQHSNHSMTDLASFMAMSDVSVNEHQSHSSSQHQHVIAQNHLEHTQDTSIQNNSTQASSHHHDASHQCQYCTVYGNLVLPPELEIKEVLDRIQVRLFAFQKAFRHVYFVLQRLFLLPQGRAPPLFA